MKKTRGSITTETGSIYRPRKREALVVSNGHLLSPSGKSCESIVSLPPCAFELKVNICSDSAVSQYSQIASLREPKPSERSALHDWITSTRDGACGFLGRDLGGFHPQQPSVYEAVHQEDLAILSDSHGEDDLFTEFINGPILKFYHWFRQHSKVRILCLYESNLYLFKLTLPPRHLCRVI